MQILRYLVFFLSYLLAFNTISLASFTSLEYIDLRTDKLNNRALKSFNKGPEVALVVAQLKKDYALTDVVETGTYKGNTTALFGYLFDNVYSIEINERFYKSSTEALKEMPNIQVIFGSSEEVLAKLLPTLEGRRILFYLDAHWGKYWPLLDELEEISKTHKDNCVIIIDDVLVPNEPKIAYDTYQGQALSYEYVQDKIKKIFTNYSVHYIIPKNIRSKGKLLILPAE
jgi:predicted O-methyltransferase YrrM